MGGNRGRVVTTLVGLAVSSAACSSAAGPGDGSAASVLASAPAATVVTAPGLAGPPVVTGAPFVGIALNDLRSAVADLPGNVDVSSIGTTAQIVGFVAAPKEARAIELAVAAVANVEFVESSVVVLDRLVIEALLDAGVSNPTVDGVGTDFVIVGIVESPSHRAEAVTLVESVPGLGSIDDQLTVG